MFHGAQPYPVDHVPDGVSALIGQNPMVGEKRSGSRRFWTMRELKILRETYPMGGINACLDALPGRSASSIYNRAGEEGLRTMTPNGEPRERRVWTTSPQIDAAIRSCFANDVRLDAVRRLAMVINRPRSWIYKRARDIGCHVPRFKEPEWTEEELELLRQHGGKHPDTVRRLFKAAGFARTSVAISLMSKRLSIFREVDENIYSCRGLGEVLGVDGGTVVNWINRGWLKAKRRKVETGDPLRGEWQIHRRDIKAFIVDNVGVLNFGKLDKHWLVELLASKVNEK